VSWKIRDMLSDENLQANHELAEGLVAFAAKQLARAAKQLALRGEAIHGGIHQSRKSLRRVRAALALGGKFDERALKLDADLRALCGGLSVARDAGALVEGLQRLRSESPTSLSLRIVNAAMRRRDQVVARVLQRDVEFASRRQRLAQFLVRLQRLDWRKADLHIIAKHFSRSAKRVEKALRALRRQPDDDENWHRYRRRLRRLRQQESIMQELAPQLMPHCLTDEAHATAMGHAQDDVLILRHCGAGSPFTPAQRQLLRQLANARLQQARAQVMQTE
jgi:hypothetical protein